MTGGKAVKIRRLFALAITALGLLLALMLTSEDNDQTAKLDPEACLRPEIPERQQVTDQQSTREYLLYLPWSYDCQPTALLVNFHGFGYQADDFRKSVGDLESIAEQNNFAVVYPQGVEREKNGPEWSPYDNDGQNILENDLLFFDALIEDVSSKINVDNKRIYAAGYSMGGMMVYGLACHRSNIVAGFGIMSGAMLPDDNCNSTPTSPIVHFHGEADFVLPFSGGAGFQSIPETMNFWLDRKGINPEQSTKQTTSGGKVEIITYGDSGEAQVHLYKVTQEYGKPGGHVWFTEDIEGKSPNQILWENLSDSPF